MLRADQQKHLLDQEFNPIEVFRAGIRRAKPWDSIIDFATHRSYCGKRLYPRQRTLLKLIKLEVENFSDYDHAVIEEWTRGFQQRQPEGVQPDVMDRIAHLKARGYNHFPHVEAILGRRGSKGITGGVLGAERMAYMFSLGDWQAHYDVDPGADGYLTVVATNMTQAMRFQFNDIRRTVEKCRYLQPHISTSKDGFLSIRTAADRARLAEMKIAKIPIEREIATLRAIAMSSNSASGRGGASYCLDPETPVLTADLRWVPIRGVQPGDELVGVDEVGESGTYRKVRTTVVEEKWSTHQKAYRLTFDDGRSVTCSANHRWLIRASSTGSNYKWQPTRGKSAYHGIKVGSQIVQLVEPWEADNTREAGYLAGAYDGEGHVSNLTGVNVFFSQNPGPVLDEVMSIMKEKGFHPQPANTVAYHNDPETKACQSWAIRGQAECLRLLGQIRPVRLLAKRPWEGVSIRGKGAKHYQQADHIRTVVAIEELPEQELIDIQTSTKTFIANGLVSHNCMFYDEFAHMIQGTGGKQSSEEVYAAYQPSLDQFHEDSLTFVPSSPYTQVGQFYDLYLQGTALMPVYEERMGHAVIKEMSGKELGMTEDDVEESISKYTANPEMLVIQLPSWALYKDWEISHTMDVQNRPLRTGVKPGPTFRGAIQLPPEESDRMRLLEMTNPEKFKVERRAQFASVIDAYLDPQRVDQMFLPPFVTRRDDDNKIVRRSWQGPVQPQDYGRFDRTYIAHADPGRTNANFAFAIAHVEDAPPDEHGEIWPHVIFDYLRVWKPVDFDEHTIDYVVVGEELHDILNRFRSTEKLSFDQWNSAGFIAQLRQAYSPAIRIVEEPFSEKVNIKRCEMFKSAINLGWVHCYKDNFYKGGEGSLLEMELKFLTEKNGKVVKQDFGPVTTKDLADCVMTVTTTLLHASLDRYLVGKGGQMAFGSSDVQRLRSGEPVGAGAGVRAGANKRALESIRSSAKQRSRQAGSGMARNRGRLR